MYTVVISYPLRPAGLGQFKRAWRVAQGGLAQTPGLTSFELVAPHARGDAYALRLIWDNAMSYQHFRRGWFGGWIVGGLGLGPAESFCPVEQVVQAGVTHARCAA